MLLGGTKIGSDAGCYCKQTVAVVVVAMVDMAILVIESRFALQGQLLDHIYCVSL